MTILALDLGTKTGVARGAPGCAASEVCFETWHMPAGGADDVGAFMSAFMQHMKDALTGVSLVIFEAPYIATGKGKSFRPNVIRRLYGMPAVVEGFAYKRAVECFEVAITTLKKEFAGKGNAEKPDMILAAHRRGFRVNNEHEADAAACWYHVIGKRYRALLEQYDPDFRTFIPRDGHA